MTIALVTITMQITTSNIAALERLSVHNCDKCVSKPSNSVKPSFFETVCAESPRGVGRLAAMAMSHSGNFLNSLLMTPSVASPTTVTATGVLEFCRATSGLCPHAEVAESLLCRDPEELPIHVPAVLLMLLLEEPLYGVLLLQHGLFKACLQQRDEDTRIASFCLCQIFSGIVMMPH
eukprot:CAMPEP_0180813740 /NCGR_PEP_ID=MMETSP1038_2-20121128/66701_1 /TAXON_ID=632150 /ORGANISM="Azadinium spinosum, Strain 3D9" /LENGTH=176 /DNA_ID=CAMNT_0022855361 /DNA_START=128 /DNA_END=656 /DNA_ORIENTATION=-